MSYYSLNFRERKIIGEVLLDFKPTVNDLYAADFFQIIPNKEQEFFEKCEKSGLNIITEIILINNNNKKKYICYKLQCLLETLIQKVQIITDSTSLPVFIDLYEKVRNNYNFDFSSLNEEELLKKKEMISVSETTYFIPRNTTIIDDRLAEEFRFSARVKIHSNVREISFNAFRGFKGKIAIDPQNEYFSVDDGTLYNIDKSALIKQSIHNCPNSFFCGKLKFIRNYAFYGCENLQKIDLRNVRVGSYAFVGADNLKILDISFGVLFTENVLHFCKSLMEIYIDVDDPTMLPYNENTFHEVDFDKCILYVPSYARSKYQKHPLFGKFKHIRNHPYKKMHISNTSNIDIDSLIYPHGRGEYHEHHGLEFVSGHYRKSYFRKDGTYVSSCNVKAHSRHK